MLGRTVPKDNPTPPKDKQDTPRREIPPSLSGVPAADATDADDGNRFAALDRLADKGGVEYEQALAALSESERDAYLASR